MKCWAESYCKWKIEGRECSTVCDGYVWLHVLYSQSNIPRLYQYRLQEVLFDPSDNNVFIKVNEICKNVLDWVKGGNNLFLYGDSGNGKTTLACHVANEYIRKAVPYAGMDAIVYYIRSFDFLDELKLHQTSPTLEFEGVLETVQEVDLLIIDDLGVEASNNWVREKLLSIFDYRIGEIKSTIVTSNLDLVELKKLHGSRIEDRLGAFTQLNLKGPSRRGEHS